MIEIMHLGFNLIFLVINDNIIIGINCVCWVCKDQVPNIMS